MYRRFMGLSIINQLYHAFRGDQLKFTESSVSQLYNQLGHSKASTQLAEDQQANSHSLFVSISLSSSRLLLPN